MTALTVPTVADEAKCLADIDSLIPVFCIYCTRREVDPDHAPYCSSCCAIDAAQE